MQLESMENQLWDEINRFAGDNSKLESISHKINYIELAGDELTRRFLKYVEPLILEKTVPLKALMLEKQLKQLLDLDNQLRDIGDFYSNPSLKNHQAYEDDINQVFVDAYALIGHVIREYGDLLIESPSD